MHLTDVKISVAAKSFQTFVTRLTSCDREFLPTIKLTWALFAILRQQKILDISNQLVHSQSQHQDYLGKELKKLVEFGN